MAVIQYESDVSVRGRVLIDGGLPHQFLKADGSLDSNTYALASSVHNPVTLGTANGLSLATQQLSLGLASSSTTGALSGTDWNTFNGKFNTPTGLTTNFLPKWNGSGFGNSGIVDTNDEYYFENPKGRITFGTSSSENYIVATTTYFGSFKKLKITSNNLVFNNGSADIFSFLSNGRVLINKTDDDLTNQLQVAGTISASPATTANQVVVKSQLDAVAARPYKVYTAVLTQQNTNAPSAVVLENTLGGTVVWTRNSTGNYYGTLNNAFPIQNKIALFQGGSMWGTLPLKIIRVQHLNSDTIQIFTQQATDGALVDSSLSGTSIEIRVYL